MENGQHSITSLTRQGMSAAKIKERLGLTISVRAVQRIQRQYFGPQYKLLNNSREFQILGLMRDYVEYCLIIGLKKNPFVCEICGDQQVGRPCEIHHTRYQGSTIFDLQFVCRSCNRARLNVSLD